MQMEQQYAGFWIRLWASVIDSVLIVLVVAPPIYLIYGKEYISQERLIAGPADFLLTWIFPAIAVTMFWIYKSATPGKMMVKIKVIDARTGGAPTAGQAIVRYLGYYLSLIPVFLGFFWVAFDARKQGWHDKIARTLVVRS
jgi:uncharacterized RDD family membrane protein YckC